MGEKSGGRKGLLYLAADSGRGNCYNPRKESKNEEETEFPHAAPVNGFNCAREARSCVRGVTSLLKPKCI